jgi:hypothetical protein
VNTWKDFRPHVVARHRQHAYRANTVMAYLDDLIAWGDQLLRQDTRESIKDATRLSHLALTLAGLLGGRAAARAFRSALARDRPFLEAYMVGLNHELARELLWREFPTDQRGGYFRQFWDVRRFRLGLADRLGRQRSHERRLEGGILLLNAFAAVADVLAFYQERQANEAFLRTATIRRSLVELSPLLSYRPRRGRRGCRKSWPAARR